MKELKKFMAYFKTLPVVTQAVLVLATLLLLVVVGTNPAFGTAIIMFLAGVKVLLGGGNPPSGTANA
jgi:hypothetical protein